MKRLNHATVYLAGPVEQDEDCHSWRSIITPKLKEIGLRVWSPLIKPQWFIDTCGELSPEEQRKDRKALSMCFTTIPGESIARKAAECKHSDILERNRYIRKICLRLVSACDFLICKVGFGTVGTFEELAIAKQQNKPVLFLMNELDSCWRVAQFYNYYQNSFKTINEICDYLHRINDGAEEVHNVEWIFLNGVWS